MKKMKLTSILCAAAVAATMALTGCGKSSDAGRYDFYSMTDDGETITAEDMKKMYEEMDMEAPEMYIQLNEDGTGKLSFDDEGEEGPEDITWKEGTITSDGEDMKYTIDDNKLTVEDDGSKIVFEKTK